MNALRGPPLSELVRAYNERHGTSLGFRGKSTLLLPVAVVQGLFTKVVSKIIALVRELLEVLNTAAGQKGVSLISPYLR